MAKAKVASITDHPQHSAAKHDTDTIRLWENYRDQALLWRSLALMQIPTTLVVLLFATGLWFTRKITLNVPRNPQPGIYSATDLPDEKFIESATEFVNLIASYQPAVAEAQFRKAREMLYAKLLEKFDSEMMNTELKAIQNTNRTQVFFADPAKTKIKRVGPSEVWVQLEGEREKVVAGKELEPINSRYVVVLTTVPHNVLNRYGIVVSNVVLKTISIGGTQEDF